jgi:hypothetical protein
MIERLARDNSQRRFDVAPSRGALGVPFKNARRALSSACVYKQSLRARRLYMSRTRAQRRGIEWTFLFFLPRLGLRETRVASRVCVCVCVFSFPRFR